MSAASFPCPRCEKWQQDWDRLRADRDMIQEFWTDLSNQILEHAPEDYDDDCAADAIAIRYVRDLEAAVYAVRQLAQRWVDEGTEAGAGLLASAVFQATGLPQCPTEEAGRG